MSWGDVKDVSSMEVQGTDVLGGEELVLDSLFCLGEELCGKYKGSVYVFGFCEFFRSRCAEVFTIGFLAVETEDRASQGELV